MLNRKIAIAPMMGYTDRHFRRFIRHITRMTLLYTEMYTTSDILGGYFGERLRIDAIEHPLAIQLGGSNPKELITCAKIAVDYGYDEINLNVGCPSHRVQQGGIGACLMKTPNVVAECVHVLCSTVMIPVTVKCRLGVNNLDSYEYLRDFIACIASAGCNTFVIHARTAWLEGLNPKENRHLPPLQYEKVYQLKKDFPHLQILINGGITTHSSIKQHLDNVDGVMIGREAYYNPYFLANVDREYFGERKDSVLSREEIVQNFIPYVEQQLHLGVKLSSITRHLLGLFYKVPRAKTWRQHLSGFDTKKGIGIIKSAIAAMNS